MLMEMQHFRNQHYRQFYKPAEQLGTLEQQIFELIRSAAEPIIASAIR